MLTAVTTAIITVIITVTLGNVTCHSIRHTISALNHKATITHHFNQRWPRCSPCRPVSYVLIPLPKSQPVNQLRWEMVFVIKLSCWSKCRVTNLSLPLPCLSFAIRTKLHCWICPFILWGVCCLRTHTYTHTHPQTHTHTHAHTHTQLSLVLCDFPRFD